MRILLIPSNNSLSHVAKCAALESVLSSRGHSVLIAVSSKHIGFVKRLGLTCTQLPDIQESDGGALPSLAWFRSPEFLTNCIQAEIELIKAFRPNRVVGIFRFTLKVSTAISGVPYDAVSCGCMMPDATEILGYIKGEDGETDQALYLDNFFRFAGKKMAVVMERMHAGPIKDIRELLIGDRTYLWDFPRFMPLPKKENRYHIGPFVWEQWPDICEPPPAFSNSDRPLAIISLGTRKASRSTVAKTARCLIESGKNVMIACGGQDGLKDVLPDSDHLRCWYFAPLYQLLCHAQLLVCHGGQMTIFESLLHQVPVLVIPSHPEQAHNGVCVERIKCGSRLAPPIAFKGDKVAYVNAYTQQTDASVIEKIAQVVSDDLIAEGLRHAKRDLQHFNAPVMIADLIEEV